jgi:membrane-associated HD superfamily phosphohydrolase
MNRDKLKSKGKSKNKKPKKVFTRVMIALVTYIFVFLILAATSVPQQHAFEVDKVSPVTVKAPRDIVDQYTTDILVEEPEIM